MSIALLGFASVGVNAIRDDSFQPEDQCCPRLARPNLSNYNRCYSNGQWTSGSHSESGLNEDGVADGEYTRSWVVTLDMTVTLVSDACQ